MGLMDIVKKLLTGATDEENARNKARMRELFNECVPEGDQYTLIYCHMEDFTDAVVVKVTTHSNFIVGYKPGEVVVVPVDAELKGHEEPVVFNKENGGQIKSTLVGYCTASKPDVTFQFEPITYEPGIKRGSKYAVRYKALQTPLNFKKLGSGGGAVNRNFMLIHYNRNQTIESITY